jgi:vacuolar-type H+-ATPase subunit I/STV1
MGFVRIRVLVPVVGATFIAAGGIMITAGLTHPPDPWPPILIIAGSVVFVVGVALLVFAALVHYRVVPELPAFIKLGGKMDKATVRRNKANRLLETDGEIGELTVEENVQTPQAQEPPTEQSSEAQQNDP